MESSIASFLGSGHEPRQTAYGAVLTALREGILSGRLPGGTRLVQADRRVSRQGLQRFQIASGRDDSTGAEDPGYQNRKSPGGSRRAGR